MTRYDELVRAEIAVFFGGIVIQAIFARWICVAVLGKEGKVSFVNYLPLVLFLNVLSMFRPVWGHTPFDVQLIDSLEYSFGYVLVTSLALTYVVCKVYLSKSRTKADSQSESEKSDE